MTEETLWSTAQTAAYLGLTVGAFRVRRHRGAAPPGIQLGPKTWRYRPADVRAWVAAAEVKPAA